MMNFTYYIPTRILFGTGTLDQLHAQQLPGKKALIVTTSGQSIRKYGYLDRVEKELAKAGVASVVFDKILPNPIERHVMEGAQVAREQGCDFVVGLGGGSSIDSAKSIALMATNEGTYWDYIAGGSGKAKAPAHRPLPVVAIATTAGTGTEADPWTVVTREETNEKIGFGYDDTFPVLSIVDPELMLTVPPALTAFQGFDALFHSTEGYLAQCANPVSEALSLRAIELIGKNLPVAVRDGKNLAAREGMAIASTISGMVESISSCLSEHSLEHALSAYHPNLPHGAGLIMISQAYYTHFAQAHACDAKMIDMARALGKADASHPMDFVIALVQLQAACGVDNLKMSDYGIRREDLPAMAKNARDTMGDLFLLDPVMLSEADCITIYEHSYR